MGEGKRDYAPNANAKARSFERSFFPGADSTPLFTSMNLAPEAA